jgi:Transcriptional Coactivator p15 (PC4)
MCRDIASCKRHLRGISHSRHSLRLLAAADDVFRCPIILEGRRPRIGIGTLAPPAELPPRRSDVPRGALVVRKRYRCPSVPAGRSLPNGRCSIEQFKGIPLISIRKWFEADDGALRPGKQGIALNIKHLPQLADALIKARSVATEDHRIPSEHTNSSVSS